MRKSALLGLAGALLLVLPAGNAGAAPIRLRLPGPGQTALGIAQMRFHGKAPRRFDVKLANRSRFGPAYRGLYAVYARRRGASTVVTFVTLILREKLRATTRPPAAASTANDSNRLSLYFLAGTRPDGAVEDEMPMRTRWGPPVRRRASQVFGAEYHTTKPSSTLNDLFKEGGVDAVGSEHGNLGGDVIDTGHYDDGHAFGWKSAGTKPALGDWLHLSANNEPYEELVEQIERDIHADLDGDGEIGGGSGGGTKIETEVGAPTIK